ncbi:hypothetical protein [Luteimonas huabeiensis]|uniref:hypothetical protein n=1 Tax=Luteimonas huabeiensis TaxID=1244513 RepID=UPI0004B50C46|nr:hypothetical protein [Luteimonas huabeiensis]
MDALKSLAVIQLAVAPLLFAVALGIRFAGTAKVLNFVDYAQVSDPAALHRWVGRRLLVLPVLLAAAGAVSLARPTWALASLVLAAAVTAVVLARVVLGAGRF